MDRQVAPRVKPNDMSWRSGGRRREGFSVFEAHTHECYSPCEDFGFEEATDEVVFEERFLGGGFVSVAEGVIREATLEGVICSPEAFNRATSRHWIY